MKQALKEAGVFSTGLNQFLKRIGSSKRAIAPKVGATAVCLSQWALGQTEPKVSSLAALIAQGMTADEIFGKDIARVLMKNSSSARK